MGPVLGPHIHTRAHETQASDPSPLLEGQLAGRGRAPNPRCPSPWQEEHPPATSCQPRSAHHQAGHACQRTSARSPRLHPATTVCGQRAPSACPKDRQLA